MKSCLILLLVALYPVVANAQQQGDVIRVNTELVQTAVTVLDKNGNFVEGVQRDQFELTVDGKQRPIAFFERVASGSARERELANLGNPNDPATSPAVLRRPGLKEMTSASVLLPGSSVVSSALLIVCPPRVVVRSTMGLPPLTVIVSATVPI